MTLEFLHLSDIHLGNQQYGNRERFNDFGRAFIAAADYALEKQVKFVLIAGDLFHKPNVEPTTLLQAIFALDKLRQASIPVLTIVGNHDRPHYHERISWLDFLSEQGYLHLLTPYFEEQGMRLYPWDGSEGSYIDIEDIRIYGLPYLGSSVTTALKELPEAIAAQPQNGIRFTILMAHFGLEGEIAGVSGGVSYDHLVSLRQHVDYLALGHWHKPFEREGWIYNPGSTEACSASEAAWGGGYYHVKLESQKGKLLSTSQHVRGPRRPYYRYTFAVDAYHTPEELYNGLSKMLSKESQMKSAALQGDESKLAEASNLAPVVEISLEGILAFDRSALDLEHLNHLIEQCFSPLLARLKNNTRPTIFDISQEADLPRRELERQVLSDLIRRDSRYRAEADFWADLMVEVKNMTLSGAEPQKTIELLRRRIKATQTTRNSPDNPSD